MKKDIIKILNKRAEHFEKIHHSFEAIEMKSAIDIIKRLMPPELFSIPVVVGTLCECDIPIKTTKDSEEQTVCKECYNRV